jgi:anti-sigma factor RsiW
MRRQQTKACERAGQWISLRLDGELSELEGATLERHLARCPACNATAAELTGITRLLRSAPLLEVKRELAEVEPRRRRGLLVVVRPALVTATMSAAAATLLLLLGGSFGSSHATRNAIEFRTTGEEVRFVRVQQRRIEPRHPSAAPTAPPMNPRGLL